MYDLIFQIIDHSWSTGTNEQQYIYLTCCVLIVVLTAVFVDLTYRMFRHFWRA